MTFKAIDNVGTRGESKYYHLKVRSKTPRPHVEPAVYQLETGEEYDNIVLETNWRGNEGTFSQINISEVRNSVANTIFGAYLVDKNRNNLLHNAALSKVADKLSYVSNFFEAWYERKEAYALLGQAGRGLYRFLTNWRKPKFWKELWAGARKAPKRPETLPEAWLLANFAVKPLVATIDDCLNLLTADFPIYWEEGSSGIEFTEAQNAELSYTAQHKRFVKMGVRVTGVNPNAQLSNIMGLTTPVSSFLSVVPWFWAVNYFVNVNQVVSNLEVRFPGVDVDKSYTTVFHKVTYTGFVRRKRYYDSNGEFVAIGPISAFLDGEMAVMDRSVSTTVPNYKLAITFPALGTSQFANLFSAIALTMKGSK